MRVLAFVLIELRLFQQSGVLQQKWPPPTEWPDAAILARHPALILFPLTKAQW